MTKRVIERAEYKGLFQSFATSLFRLETRNEYNVPFEEEAYQRFLGGTRPEPDESDLAWKSLIQRHRQAGRIWQKVHVVDLPLSDYLRFEIATAYDVFSPAGEEVGMIERQSGTITDEIGDQDFWLFDDKYLVLMNYADDGQVISRELVVDESDLVAIYVSRKDKALIASTPYKDFCASLQPSLSE